MRVNFLFAVPPCVALDLAPGVLALVLVRRASLPLYLVFFSLLLIIVWI
jgi:hypothetical protein